MTPYIPSRWCRTLYRGYYTADIRILRSNRRKARRMMRIKKTLDSYSECVADIDRVVVAAAASMRRAESNKLHGIMPGSPAPPMQGFLSGRVAWFRYPPGFAGDVMIFTPDEDKPGGVHQIRVPFNDLARLVAEAVRDHRSKAIETEETHKLLGLPKHLAC